MSSVQDDDQHFQQTFAEHLETVLSSESIYGYNAETFGPAGTLAGASDGDVVIALDLRVAIARLVLNIQDFARDRAIEDDPTARDLLVRRLMRGEIAV